MFYLFYDPTLATDNDDRRFDRRFDESSALLPAACRSATGMYVPGVEC